MKLPIPADWDGETWECYSIQWPASQMWTGYLYGSISQYSRGRIWDGRTGSIVDAQAMGTEIFNRNNPLASCASQCDGVVILLLELFADFLGCAIDIPAIPETITEEWIAQLFGCCLENKCDELHEEDNCMAVNDIKCENGKLYKYMCCQWIEVCDFGEMLGEYIPEDVPEPDPPPTDNNCFKAGAFAEHFTPWLVGVNSIVQSNLIYSNSVLRDMVVATYPANQWQWYPIVNAIQIVKWYPATINEALGNQNFETILRCAIYNVLNEHSSPADSDNWQLTYEQMQYIQSYVATELDFDPHANAYIGQFLMAIAASYAQTAIATYDPADYDCTGCDSTNELSPQSGISASGWFMTQGYYGDGVQSRSGNAYNTVCLVTEPDYPFNCWGIAFDAKTFNPTPLGMSGYETPCTGEMIDSSGASISSNTRYIVCTEDVYNELLLVSDGSQDYVWIDGGSDNVNIPEKTAGTDFQIVARAGFQVDVIAAEATNARFICNTNNLGV